MLQHGFIVNNSHRSTKLRHLRGFVVVCLASLFASHDVTTKSVDKISCSRQCVTQKLFRRFQDRKRMTRGEMIKIIASSTLSFSSLCVTSFWRGSNLWRREQEKEKYHRKIIYEFSLKKPRIFSPIFFSWRSHLSRFRETHEWKTPAILENTQSDVFVFDTRGWLGNDVTGIGLMVSKISRKVQRRKNRSNHKAWKAQRGQNICRKSFYLLAAFKACMKCLTAKF